jgi:sugar phosphate isomerase/epimerase
MQKLALSTSFTSNRPHTGKTLLDLFKQFNVTGLELDYRIDEVLYKQIREELQQSRLKVVSLHNFFPIPSVMSHTGGSGDLFPLSHPNREERKRAIEWTAQSIDHAHDLGALAVVLHCGYVDMNPELDRLYYYHNTNQIISKEARAFIGKKMTEREGQKAKHLEALLFSLDRLASAAVKKEILLGLENRYHYHELPGIKELGVLFKKFKGAPIGYWHDTGHAHANEILGFLPYQSLLQKFSDRLIGIHLHDAIGLEDHLAPGTGEIEFDCLKDYIKPDTLLVMELKPGTPDKEVSRAIHFLRNLGFN